MRFQPHPKHKAMLAKYERMQQSSRIHRSGDKPAQVVVSLAEADFAEIERSTLAHYQGGFDLPTLADPQMIRE